MTLFLYILLGWIILVPTLIFLTRKKMDIDLGVLLGIIFVSFFPFLREFILIFVIFHTYSINIDISTVIFKKYTK